MTTQVYGTSAPLADASTGRRRIFLAPFGWYTRYMLRGYGQHIFMVTAGLVIVALSLDLSRNFNKLMAFDPGAQGLMVLRHIGWYTILRAVDHLTYMLPLGSFLGTLWFEVMLTLTGERVMIWNSGRSPAQCLFPMLLVIVFVGGVEYVLETRLRPAAIQAQAASKLGDYGERFDRTLSNERFWLAAGAALVHARIEYGPPPSLRDAMIYRHGPDGNLSEVISARTAVPGAEENQWTLRDTTRWRPPTEAGQEKQSGAPEEEAIAEMTILLELDPLWLSNYRIYAKFLPQSVLETLANAAGGRYAAADYLTYLHFRNAQILYPGSMALLAACLALLFLAQGGSAVSVMGIAFAGYAGYVSGKACLLLGEHGYLAPVVAAWFTPMAMILAAAVALGVVSLRNTAARRRAA